VVTRPHYIDWIGGIAASVQQYFYIFLPNLWSGLYGHVNATLALTVVACLILLAIFRNWAVLPLFTRSNNIDWIEVLAASVQQHYYIFMGNVSWTIYVENINLQMKNIKECFFTFIKKSYKKLIKTLNYTIHSSKKHRQYSSNEFNNTATKHSLCPGNGVFAHEKCVIFEILYVFVSETK